MDREVIMNSLTDINISDRIKKSKSFAEAMMWQRYIYPNHYLSLAKGPLSLLARAASIGYVPAIDYSDSKTTWIDGDYYTLINNGFLAKGKIKGRPVYYCTEQGFIQANWLIENSVTFNKITEQIVEV